MTHKKLPPSCETNGCFEDAVVTIYIYGLERPVHLCADCLLMVIDVIKGSVLTRCTVCKTRFIIAPDKTEVK